MEKTRKLKMNLGIFVILGTVILIAALYFIGNRQHLFQENIFLKAQFYNVNGLQIGNNVRFAGIEVGNVSKIVMTSDSTIVIDLRIRKETTDFLRSNAIATIGSDGLVGNMIVNITPRKGEAPPVNQGDTLLTYSKIATDDMLSTLSVTNENAALLTSDLLQITGQILDGEGTLGMLINDSLVARNLKRTVLEINETSRIAHMAIRDLNSYSKSLQKPGSVVQTLFADTLAGIQLKEILNNVAQASSRIDSMSGNLSKALYTFENSKGTYHYLIKDTLLPQMIETTVQEIKQSSERLNDNMEALKSNLFFRGYFKKQERLLKRRNQTLEKE